MENLSTARRCIQTAFQLPEDKKSSLFGEDSGGSGDDPCGMPRSGVPGSCSEDTPRRSHLIGRTRQSASRPFARSYSIAAQMKGPTPLQSFSMTGSEM